MLNERAIYADEFVTSSTRSTNGQVTGGTMTAARGGHDAQSTGYVTVVDVSRHVQHRGASPEGTGGRRIRRTPEAFELFRNVGLGHVPVELRAPWTHLPIKRPSAARAYRLATARRPVHARRERLPVRSRPGRRRRRTSSA